MDENTSAPTSSKNSDTDKITTDHANAVDMAVFDVMIDGVARLIDAQRRFAVEFGLADRRVFFDGFEAFKGDGAAKVLRDWLNEGEAGAQRMKKLFEDIYAHKLALMESMDGVALYAIRKTSMTCGSPQKDSTLGRIYKATFPTRHGVLESLEHDAAYRYREVVTPALMMTYSKFRASYGGVDSDVEDKGEE